MNESRQRWIVGLGGVCAALLLLLLFFAVRDHGGGGDAGLSRDGAKHAATTITTSAAAHRTVDNNAVDISVSVSVSERDLLTTQQSLSTKTNALMAFLKSAQVEHLRTDALSFTPDTRYQKKGPDRTVGYNGSVTVSLRTTPEKAPEVLAGVLTHGANTILGTTFTTTTEQMTKAHDELAAEATATALSQANAMARAAGSHVLTVLSITTETAPPTRPDAAESYEADLARAAARPAPPPIQVAAGDREMSVTVQMVAAAEHN